MTPIDLYRILMLFLTLTTSGPFLACDAQPPTECTITNESSSPRTAAVLTVDGITYEVMPDYEIKSDTVSLLGEGGE